MADAKTEKQKVKEIQPDYLLPGLPEAYHPQTDRRAHEENAGECDAIGAK